MNYMHIRMYGVIAAQNYKCEDVCMKKECADECIDVLTSE